MFEDEIQKEYSIKASAYSPATDKIISIAQEEELESFLYDLGIPYVLIKDYQAIEEVDGIADIEISELMKLVEMAHKKID